MTDEKQRETYTHKKQIDELKQANCRYKHEDDGNDKHCHPNKNEKIVAKK